MGHTSGPWEVTEDGLFVTAGKDKGGAPVTIACSSSPHEWREDDAKLISAAPELLLACEAMFEDIEDMLVDCDSPGTRQTLEIQRRFLKGAIDKAKGVD
jgi:hypothetical protein